MCVDVCECAPYVHAGVFTSFTLEHSTPPSLNGNNTKFASHITNNIVNACV